MDEMTTNDDILAQDNIDALFADTENETSGESSEEASGRPDRQGEESVSNELLGQDDIDALLAESGREQASQEISVDRHTSNRPGKPNAVSDEDVIAMSIQIHNRGYLIREEGVRVIWNALGTLPMNSGSTIHIQGMDYISLGILHEKHLVVRHEESHQ